MVTLGNHSAHAECLLNFWAFVGHVWVKIDPKIDIFTKSWRMFFSGKVQNGFETQNGFTRSGFIFLVVEIGLKKTPI